MEPATYVVDAVSRLQPAVHQIGNLRLEPWQMSLSGDAAGPGHTPHLSGPNWPAAVSCGHRP